LRARPLCILISGFLLGILLNFTGNKWILLPVAGVFLWLVNIAKREKSRLSAYGKLLFYSAGLLCGIWRYEVEKEFRAAYEPLLEDGMQIVLQGDLEEKEYKNNTYLYYLKNCYLKLEPVSVPQHSNITGDVIIPCNQVIAELEKDVCSIGKILVLEGKVSVFHQARNEGNFDEKSFYQSQKIDFKLKKVTVKKQYGETDEFRETLYQLKQRLKYVYNVCMTPETGGVITMMALGDKSLMDAEIKELYQKVGISHILAISGLHISVIGMSLYKLLRKLFGSYVVSGVLAGGFMFVYGCMTGFRPSSTRAIVMFFMMLVAQMIGRTYDSLSALSLSAVFLLWENPFLLSYAGFLFSYMAVLGAVVVANVVTQVFKEKHKLRDAIYTSFSIQLMTVPLTAYFYYEVPVYGMMVNFLVLPLMSMLLFFGLLGGFAGLIWLKGARWILVPCQLILLLYQKLSVFMQGLPSATLIVGQPEVWRMIAFYGVLMGVVYVIWKRKKVRGYIVTGVMLLAFVLYVPKVGMELNMLDVGQGDGIYLRTSSGQNVFIDGGSSDVSKVGTYRILPFLKYNGVRGIDYWFVSHADEDHISGVRDILEEGYPVATLVFAESVVQDEAYRELVTLAQERGTEVLHMGYLDCLHIEDARLTSVFPYDGFVTDDKNAASLVLYYQDGEFDGLFTGDIGTDEEAWIAEHSDEWLGERSDIGMENADAGAGIDFYKVAHHGSKYSNSRMLLETLRPEYAVVSAGVNNWYGHPHVDTLERLEAAGCEVGNTAECGQIKINRKNEITILFDNPR